MEIKTTEFFKNIKKLPPIGSKEFEDLVKWEEEKCLRGVTINGILISGYLYGLLNHWHIRIDKKDNYGNIERIKSLPHLRDNEWIIAEGLERGRVEQKGYLHIGTRQAGKDLLNSSKLYQEGKEITIGECKIGDQIFDDSGNLTTIVGKYPQGKKPVYKITLLDGRELYCGLDHNWYVYDRLKKEYCKKTTRDLLPDYKRYRKSWSHRKNPFEFKYSIPTSKAVEYSEKKQLIDPYFIGLYLGDGSNYYSKITSIDKEIVDYLYLYAEKVGLQISRDGDMTYMITSGNRGGNMSDNRNFIYTYLKDNLFQNKHIPSEYLYGSVQQRMDLLAGLLDSDGYCAEKGTIEFSSTIPRLAEDFEFLCRSLGINIARKNKKCFYKDKNGLKVECKDTDRFSLFTSKKVFRLTRKLERQVSKPKYEDKVGICNIEYVFDDETTCIEVNNNSHLFLTDGFTITHNSENEAAYCGLSAILYENSQNVVVGGNDADLALLKDKVDFGLKNFWEGLKISRLDKTWKDNMIRLGFKHKDGEDDIWSYIIIRNAKDGHNTETAAGTTAKSFICDEIGKFAFAQSFEAAKPAFNSEFGWRAVPMLCGTGGAFEKGADAERYFYNPEANNFISYEDEKTGVKTGLFMSGLYRQDCKDITNLADYLTRIKGMELKETSELEKIEIRVTNEEKALAKILEEREEKKKDPDQTEYLKQIMYYPLTVEECFMTVNGNLYNAEAARARIKKINSEGITGQYVEVYHDGTKLTHKHSNKLPVSTYPAKKTENKDAPVVMWEAPMENPPFGLYVFGADPYRTDQSEWSESLGSIYIYKRVHSIAGEDFQDMFVAAYCARPKTVEDWCQNAMNLIEYYNAYGLVENDDMGFINWIIRNGKEHHLAASFDFLKSYKLESKTSRTYGIHRSNPRIVTILRNNLKTYLNEKIGEFVDEKDEKTGDILGVNRVFDTMLLEEVSKFNGILNADREVAASLAVTIANYLDPVIGVVGQTNQDPRFKAIYSRNKIPKQTFSNLRTPTFSKRKR